MEDLHEKWDHRWMHQNAKSFDSPMHGMGIKSVGSIMKGETVIVLGGVIVPKSDIEEYWRLIGRVGVQINEDFFICPTSREELEKTGAINHSCEPNLICENKIVFIASRDIGEGEELTFDYSSCETHFPGFECKCGSEKCRGFIGKKD